MGMGIGAAMTGLRPIVEGMNMGFLLLAYNQISNNAGMLHYTSGGQYKVCSCFNTDQHPCVQYIEHNYKREPIVEDMVFLLLACIQKCRHDAMIPLGADTRQALRAWDVNISKSSKCAKVGPETSHKPWAPRLDLPAAQHKQALLEL